MYIPTKFICYSVLWLVLLYCQHVALYSVDNSVIMGDEFETILKKKSWTKLGTFLTFAWRTW